MVEKNIKCKKCNENIVRGKYMRIKNRKSKIIGISVIILLVSLSINTFAMVKLDEINASNNLPYSENMDGAPYKGHLRVYVVEIISRWDDYSGEPYHFGFIDFAYDDTLSIDYLDTYTDSMTWTGDVEENNIMVMAAVFNSKTHLGYAYPPTTSNPFEAFYVDAAAGTTPGNIDYNTNTENFTHTVFIEEGTATWCHNCPIMAETMHSIHESEDYPFYYVALIDNKSAVAANRLRNDYNLYGFPTAFFDGGKDVLSGGVSDEAQYRTRIETCGARDVHELDLALSVEWLSNGDIQINISITNNEEIEEITDPIIQIGDIRGGIFGVSTIISNIGGVDANDVEWSMTITGGISKLLNISTEGTIPTLDVGDEVQVSAKKVFLGLGKVDIIFTANEATKVEEGFVLGSFVIISK